jgi:hypothetical protein
MTILATADGPDWGTILIQFLGNTFVLAVLGYYFNRRLKSLESDLKHKGMVQETVFKNSAATIKEATRRIVELKAAVGAYSMIMPARSNEKEQEQLEKEQEKAVREQYQNFRKWFAVENLHLSDELKLDITTVVNHLSEIAWMKGLVLLDQRAGYREIAHQKNIELQQLHNETRAIFENYDAKMKIALGVK